MQEDTKVLLEKYREKIQEIIDKIDNALSKLEKNHE